MQSQVNEAFVSAASEAVSEIFKDSIADAAGNLDSLQENVVSDIQKVSDNIASYQQILSEFQATFQDSDAQIKEVQSAMDQVKSSCFLRGCCSGCRGFCTSGRKKQCLIIFFCTIWNADGWGESSVRHREFRRGRFGKSE